MTVERSVDLDAIHALGVRLAGRAATIHRKGLERGFEIGQKSGAGDLVTEIDRAAERAIVEGIETERPDDAILGEEGTDRAGSSGVRWVIDPLDGTASYVRGYPGYAVSIGVEVDDEPAVGVVVDALGRRTDAVAGRTALRDGRPVVPSSVARLEDAVLATGFGYESVGRVAEARVLEGVIGQVADIRRSGSAAIDLCGVATGEVDAYYELHLAPWDVAAGRVIVEVAGAVFRQFPQPDGTSLTIASPAGLVDPLLKLLRSAGLSA